MDYTNLKVSELKQLLKERNLLQIGLKAELISRLQEYDSNPTTVASIAASAAVPAAAVVVAKVAEPVAEAPVIDSSNTESKSAIKPPTIEASTEESNVTSPAKRAAEDDDALTAEDRKRLRAEKFGIKDENTMKGKRAERFGIPQAGDELPKLKNRAERFGAAVSPIILTAEEKEKIEKRKNRFGVVTTDNSTTKTTNNKVPLTDEAILKRQNRFGVVEKTTEKTKFFRRK